jgi:hypothetical protein
LAYTFDAENRIATTAAETYDYDGDGNRVFESAGGTAGTTNWHGAAGSPANNHFVPPPPPITPSEYDRAQATTF